MQSENLLFPEDTAGRFPGTGTSIRSHNRIIHAISQSHFLGEEGFSVTLVEKNPFPSNLVIEKSP